MRLHNLKSMLSVTLSLVRSGDTDHAPYGEKFCTLGWDLPNLNSIASPIGEILNGV